MATQPTTDTRHCARCNAPIPMRTRGELCSPCARKRALNGAWYCAYIIKSLHRRIHCDKPVDHKGEMCREHLHRHIIELRLKDFG